ncbi:glutathione ABC transporter substrate-binding protein GsiB [Sutterella sp.]|uniref:glutathione ABC transporter substrate-binding protein GsiB n=1 Tax=Sutterella sp. TaxID=1981025 RepID=UPI0026DFCB48|nr:glutathione ABC transporter substrate-binding protein GsiB [Sutterella sp.]MDO5532155.1 glutathione ABC transporter substrate-binding protein GsiB [Sutterella sp.]
MTSFKKAALALSLAGIGALAAQSALAAEITVSVYAAFTTLDPYDASDTISQNVAKSFYEGLFGFDKDMKLVNVLAEGYDVSPDGLEYTIRLKKGIQFSDGEPFNAAAVKANFERVLNPENRLTRYQLYRNIAGVDVVDEYTAKFRLKEPFSAFINQLAHPSGVMMCPKILGMSKKDIAFNPCGTGPYLIEKYNPAEYLVVKKNPNYWQKGLPKLDGITWRPVLEDATRVAMLRTGESQFCDVVPPEHAARLKEDEKLVVETMPTIIQRQIYLNVTKKPFNDLRVRQALNYGLDKNAMVKVLYKGYAGPATGPAPVGIDFAEQYGAWPYDPAKAKQLLAEAGYPNGFSANLWAASNSSANQKMLQFLQQQYARIGVKLQVRALEAGQRVQLVQSVGPEKSTTQMFVWGWSSSTGELDWVLRPLLATSSFPPANSNFGYYSNPKLDEALQAALKTTDRAEKAKIYSEAQKIIWADAPWVFLTVDHSIAARAKNLEGFYTLPDGGFEFSHAELK